MTTYVNPYTGQTLNPSQVGYESLTISTDTTLVWPINGTPSSNVVANIIEVTATANNLKLILPAATQVSVGQAIIIRNVGGGGNYSINVVTNVANTVIVNIPVSASGANSNTYYIYLTNNSTQDGTWSSIAMGIGTSSATAGALAGNGLIAVSNTLNENTPVTIFNADYTFINPDRAQLFAWTGGAGTATLPNPALIGAGWFVLVKNNGTGILTVSGVGSGYSNVIDPSNPGGGSPGGTSTVQLQVANSSIFVTDGTYWYTYALAQTNVFNYTQLIINVNTPAITSSPYLLSAANAKNVIQEYTGTLTFNLLVLVPQTVQMYSFRNLTSGSYSLTFGVTNAGGTAAAGSTVTVPANQAIIVISDGTNLYNANSASTSTIASLQLGNGSAANPSLSWQNDSTTGLYSPASGNIGISIGGSQVGILASTGLQLIVGINSGVF
jgi:hypothetical protein